MVSVAAKGAEMFQTLAPNGGPRVALSDDAWLPFAESRRAHHAQADAERRRTLAKSEDGYWTMRHKRAREQAAKLSPAKVPVSKSLGALTAIDHFINTKLETQNVEPAPYIDDFAFLRRLALDTAGRVPTIEEINQFFAELAPSRESRLRRRVRAIDRFLQNPSWADHWVSYWQDVLAENPGILKPMLNNTGPFRWWIHDSFADNKAMDRFATELVLMEGSAYYGGPAGFGMASENDVPTAQKA